MLVSVHRADRSTVNVEDAEFIVAPAIVSLVSGSTLVELKKKAGVQLGSLLVNQVV